jgi:hypothetical protein
MLNRAVNTYADQTPTTSSMTHAEPVQDISGYTVFSAGEAGAAHVMAHQMLDENRIELGHQLLSEWLRGRTGSGSEWIHLQFHMAVFDLALDDWRAAYTRFMDEILPVAATTEEALTDAPALLWRLALAAPEPIELPWEALRRTALARMQRPSDPFVELHNLLALAGAGDIASIEQWLQMRTANVPSRPERLVEQMAVALKAYAARAYRHAATVMQSVVPQLPQVGGSRAQNLLFQQLEESCWYQVDDATFASLYANIA